VNDVVVVHLRPIAPVQPDLHATEQRLLDNQQAHLDQTLKEAVDRPRDVVLPQLAHRIMKSELMSSDTRSRGVPMSSTRMVAVRCRERRKRRGDREHDRDDKRKPTA
jgi:hypothetical protein